MACDATAYQTRSPALLIPTGPHQPTCRPHCTVSACTLVRSVPSGLPPRLRTGLRAWMPAAVHGRTCPWGIPARHGEQWGPGAGRRGLPCSAARVRWPRTWAQVEDGRGPGRGQGQVQAGSKDGRLGSQVRAKATGMCRELVKYGNSARWVRNGAPKHQKNVI